MSTKRWKTIEENVKLMLFRDRKYTLSNNQEQNVEKKTNNEKQSKKRRKEENEDTKKERKQFMAKYSISFPPDWPDDKDKKWNNNNKEKTVKILFLNELDMEKWETIYSETKQKHVDDLILVSLNIQPAVQHALERLSFDKENNLRVECFEGSSLMNDLLSHRMNLQNRPTLLSPCESRAVHTKMFKNAELPVLKTNDVVAAWLGARPHQLVQYDRVSRGVGASRAYRVVQ